MARTPLPFFVLPVVVCGIAFGLRGALGAAVVGDALFLVGSELSLAGYLARAVVLVLLGAVVGVFADEWRRKVDDIDRQNELSVDLIGTASFDGFFKRLTPAWTRLLGYSHAELLARPFLEFFHPDDHDAIATRAAALVELGGELRQFQNRMRCRDGSYRWLEWDVRADADARLFILAGRDISERKQAEEREELRSRELALALEDSREAILRLNLVGEAVLDGLVTFDEQGKIVKFNGASERIFGYRRAEVIGADVSVLVTDSVAGQHAAITNGDIRTDSGGDDRGPSRGRWPAQERLHVPHGDQQLRDHPSR